MKVTGTIEKIGEVTEGTSKSGKAWKKVEFVLVTPDQYNNLYAFTVFGEEKVDKFIKYNKVGSRVDVDFNVETREYNDKYYTNLQAWKIFKAESNDTTEEEDLPY